MLCESPYQKGPMALPCGGCRPCRVNRSRLWTGRMLLESMEWATSAFVTLTYNEEKVPSELDARDLTLFLKRVREAIAPRKIRYYAVGEYGDNNWRPHFHLIMFGISPTEGGLIEKCWTMGYVFMGTAEGKSMSYVSQYVNKKLTNPKDQRLNGRRPEFVRMSQGIGKGVVDRCVVAMATQEGKAAYQKIEWIAEKFRVQGFKFPFGRYLKTKILDALGITREIRGKHNAQQIWDAYLERVGKTSSEWAKERRAKVEQARGRLQRKRRHL